MATADTTSHPDTTEPQSPTSEGGARAGVKQKPYAAPKLKHLGSVRDLTLGASNLAGEGGMRMM